MTDIDYKALAELEPHCGLSWDALCARAEAGLPLPAAPNRDWLTLQQAAARLRMEYSSISTQLAASTVRWKSRSTKNPKSRRGCGLLYSAADIERVAHIRREVRCSVATALRVFDAQRKGAI